MNDLVTVRHQRQVVVSTEYAGLGPAIPVMSVDEARTILNRAETARRGLCAAPEPEALRIAKRYVPSPTRRDDADDGEGYLRIDEEFAAEALAHARGGNTGEALLAIERAVDSDVNAREAIRVIRRKLNLT